MKFAIFLPNWIGDACMATPALRALRQGLSRNVRLVGVARPGPAALLEDQPWLDEMIVYQPRASEPRLNRRRLVSELAGRKFDAALLFPNSLSTAVIATLARIPRRIGYAGDGRAWMLTEQVRPAHDSAVGAPVPIIDAYLNLAGHVGCPSIDRNMALIVDDKFDEQADRLWKAVGFQSSSPTVVINNNAATSPARLWPVDRIVRLAQKLTRHPDIQVLLHCSPKEREGARQIVEQAAHPRIQSMGVFEELPLGLSLAVLKKSSAVVSTDSGARLMAVAVNKPVISLYGPTKPELTTTYNRPETILRVDDQCITCRKTPPHKAEAGSSCTCMKQISVEQVYFAVLEQLKAQHGFESRRAA